MKNRSVYLGKRIYLNNCKFHEQIISSLIVRKVVRARAGFRSPKSRKVSWVRRKRQSLTYLLICCCLKKELKFHVVIINIVLRSLKTY